SEMWPEAIVVVSKHNPLTISDAQTAVVATLATNGGLGLCLNQPVVSAEACRMDEGAVEPLLVRNGVVALDVGPKKIATVKVRLAGATPAEARTRP
ncbi:MAG: hypothetical protein NTW87_25795, partial [Planctomycetota bacterium]|nr:hypothetical protein [Planctomycetota bacterium]